MMRLAICAVSLSVATMIVTIATVTGFQNGIRDKVVKVHGNFIIDHAANVEGSEPLVIQSKSITKNLSIFPGIERIAISSSKACIIKGEDEIDGVVSKGMNWDDFEYSMGDYVKHRINFTPIINKSQISSGSEVNPKKVQSGSWVYVSQSMADRMKLDTGQMVTLVYFIEDSMGNRRPRAARPLVAGIYETGIDQIDNHVVFVNRDLVQRYQKPSDGFTQIEIWESSNKSIDFLSLNAQLPAGQLRISDSKQFHRQIYDWLAILNTNVWVIVILMALVSLIAMSTILLIIMVEKTSFIGVAQSMGASIASIQKVFIWQSGIIVIFGLIFGDLLAIGLCYFQQKTHFLTLNQEVYFVKYVMVHIDGTSIFLVNLGILLASILTAIVPVQWIKRMTPSKAIRFQ